MTTTSPSRNVQQAPATGGLTPKKSQRPQTNFYGISPSSPDSNESPTQNSSFTQQGEQVPANNISVLEADIIPDSKRIDSIDREISIQTKKAVEEFISRVQGTVEERLEEAIKLRTPFELVTPTPFESEPDDKQSEN
jgi:hypothetical protein